MRAGCRPFAGGALLPTAIAAASVLTGPLLYPLWLALTTRGSGRPRVPVPGSWPDVLVVIPAFREQHVIAAKIADLRSNGYPGRLRLLVVAEDGATAEAAARSGAEVIRPASRLGKAAAINAGIGAGAEPICVVTDADAGVAPGALAAMVRWFEDPRVGAVAGEKRVRGAGQGAYWRFESWLKRRESRRGRTLGVVGELAAVRRVAFRELPTDAVVDDLWMGLDVIEAGWKVQYEPDAAAFEDAQELAAEWERRGRIQAGLIDLLVRRRRLLVPGRSPIAVELWGHKLIRSVLAPPAHLLLLAQAITAAPRSAGARLFTLTHLIGLAALWRQNQGGRPSAIERVAGQLVFLQAVALAGIARYLGGDRPARWRKQERPATAADVFQRGDPPATGTAAHRPR